MPHHGDVYFCPRMTMWWHKWISSMQPVIFSNVRTLVPGLIQQTSFGTFRAGDIRILVIAFMEKKLFSVPEMPVTGDRQEVVFRDAMDAHQHGRLVILKTLHEQPTEALVKVTLESVYLKQEAYYMVNLSPQDAWIEQAKFRQPIWFWRMVHHFIRSSDRKLTTLDL